MFCPKCGKESPNNATFCSYCGTRIIQDSTTIQPSNSFVTNLVPAKCLNCGGILEVNPLQDAAICKFCNTPFIVNKAIENYNITSMGNININNATVNVTGAPSVSNLLERAKAFEKSGDINSSINYYNRVLDIDFNNLEAKESIYRLQNEPIISFPVSTSFSVGSLQIKYDSLVFVSKKGKEKKYEFSEIIDVKKQLGSLSIVINKPMSVGAILNNTSINNYTVISYGILGNYKAKEVAEIINNARKGIFPPKQN